MRRPLALVVALGAALPGALGAQGSLGSQGYGYPTGQISSASLALGGAPAELDPSSPINPAAIASASRYTIYMMYEPEFRMTTVSGASDRSTTMRFPNFMITGGYKRFVGSVSASTLLDRTWTNVYSDSVLLDGEWLPSIISAASNGAITDARVAAGWWFSPRLQAGIAVHGLTGENRLAFGRSFPDSIGLGSVANLSTINFSGRAISFGVVGSPLNGVNVGASYRKGGQIEARQDSAQLATADAPDRYGLSVSYTGIPNTSLGVRFEHVGWSAMRGLGTANMSTFDTDEFGAGVEVVGPRMAGAPSMARLGLRSRTLPFGAAGDQVKESAVSGGVSLPLARGRGQIDLTLQRAARRGAGASERAWFVSLGFGIRP